MTKDRDPVCGKPVDTTEKKFRATYETDVFYFCSTACMDTFKQDPEKYVEPEEGHK